MSGNFILSEPEFRYVADRLQYLADHPEERAAMGQQAPERIQGFGGWRDYGQKAMAIFEEVLQR